MTDKDFTSFYKMLAEAYTLPPHRAQTVLKNILRYFSKNPNRKEENRDELLQMRNSDE